MLFLFYSLYQVNGRIVLEGVLRVFWGVSRPIQLKPKDDTPPPKSWRRSYSMAINNGLEDELLLVRNLLLPLSNVAFSTARVAKQLYFKQSDMLRLSANKFKTGQLLENLVVTIYFCIDNRQWTKRSGRSGTEGTA